MNSNVKSRNRSILTYATAMWLACAFVAFDAHAGDDVRSETVRFADLNVGTPAGVEALSGLKEKRMMAAGMLSAESPN